MKRIELWSSGGGTQSTAIAALLCMGKLSAPDKSIIVDTERESYETWEYLDKYVNPALIEHGIELHRVSKSQYATVDLYRNDDLLIPAFTDENGSVGKLPTYCSNEWKKRVVRRWASEQCGKDAVFNVWIGFSTDEPKRLYQEVGKWQPRYPLFEMGMSRGDCYAAVKRMGWPEPPKSSCWMCPNRSHAAWMDMKNNRPEDWNKAVEFEKEIRVRDDAVYLHRSGITLPDVPEKNEQQDMFTGRCDSGYCFT